MRFPPASMFDRVPDYPITRKRRTAILGGSFDPIHMGHMQIAKAALEKLGVQEVWFLPARQAPLKERQLSDDKVRTEMIEAAIGSDARLKVCTLELDRPGTSYTIDTIRELKALHPDMEFTFLIGADQLRQFDKWKDWKQLLELARFVCVDRNGEYVQNKFGIGCMHMPAMDVSSTLVRKGCRLNYMDQRVLDVMYANRLYVKEFVKSRVNEHRYLHSLSVANLCEQFAQSNGLDANRAWLAGMVHDICKAMSPEKMRPWMVLYAPDKLSLHTAAWHGFVGAAVLWKIFGLHDEAVCNAVYHHVQGTSRHPIAMAVFCADKLDPLRGYDSYGLIEACRKDLEAGFALCKEANYKYFMANKEM